MTNHGKLPLLLALLLYLSLQITFAAPFQPKAIPFPESVIKEMATRKSRYHHFLWHAVRDNWLKLTDEQKKELEDLGWGITRPSLSYDDQGNSIVITDNKSGEDFLYMHREMIATVNKILAKNKEPYGCVKGWKKIPPPGDKEYPVPPAYVVTDVPFWTDVLIMLKSDDFYWNTLKPMEDFFTNPEELKKMSLGEFGARLEMTIHNWLHMRFSDFSTYGFRPRTEDYDVLFNIDIEWEDMRYNWLGDVYAAHCNPTFWMLHGWVDDRLEDWRKAHGLKYIPWTATWTGGPLSWISGGSGGHDSHGDYTSKKDKPLLTSKNGNVAGGNVENDDILDRVAGVFRKAKLDAGFNCNVKVDFSPKKNS